jgi:hypothetical protein
MNSPSSEKTKHIKPIELVLELLKLGPVTVDLCEYMKLTKSQTYNAVYDLRKKGWPILLDMVTVSDGYGLEKQRGEYRLAKNWEQKELFH